MTPEERKILIDMQVEKAHRFVKQVDKMMDMDYSDMAVNRFFMHASILCRPFS